MIISSQWPTATFPRSLELRQTLKLSFESTRAAMEPLSLLNTACPPSQVCKSIFASCKIGSLFLYLILGAPNTVWVWNIAKLEVRLVSGEKTYSLVTVGTFQSAEPTFANVPVLPAPGCPCTSLASALNMSLILLIALLFLAVL